MVILTNQTTTQRLWRRNLAATCGLLLAACGSLVEGTDSSTHWLDQCSDDDDCGSGLQCECGSCTTACDANRDCNGLTEATCATAQCGERVVAACTKACDKDAECGGGECFEGTCTFALQCTGPGCGNDEDASVSSSSTGDLPATTDEAGTQEPNETSDFITCLGDDCNGATTSLDEEDGGMASNNSSDETAETSGSAESSEVPVSACPAMDVADNGDDCIGDVVSYWNGSECISVQWCGCTGSDCAEVFGSVEECQSSYAACIDDIPECTDQIFIEGDGETEALIPRGIGISFQLEGDEPDEFEEDPSAAPFADFTTAEWRGQEQPDAGEPDPYSLTFIVDGERTKFNFYFGDWDWPLPYDIGGVQRGDMVEVRVLRSNGAPVELQVRDTSGTPFLWMVQNAPGAIQTQWSFGDLNARIGAPICKRTTEVCNWLFTLDQLVLQFGAVEGAVGPGESWNTGPGAPRYQVMSDSQFSNNKTAFGDEACASDLPRYDAFLVWRDDDPEDD